LSDVVGLNEQEPGPSWARPNWPLSELDDINLGLDPTQATIEAFKKAAGDKAVAAAPRPPTPTRSAARPKTASAR
jgi:2-oxoglutarate dehydrogenase E1 component